MSFAPVAFPGKSRFPVFGLTHPGVSFLLFALLLVGFIPKTLAVPNPVVTSSVLITRTGPVLFDINFGEEVTGFELSDIQIGNGTAANLLDSGTGQNNTDYRVHSHINQCQY